VLADAGGGRAYNEESVDHPSRDEYPMRATRAERSERSKRVAIGGTLRNPVLPRL
jgi:hypothetical protein